MSITNLGYHGTVKIQQFKRGKLKKIKTIRNAGTHALFRILCNALSGSYTAAQRPAYLDVGYFSSAGATTADSFTSVLYGNNLPLVTVEEAGQGDPDSIDSCSVTFAGTVTHAYLASTGGAHGNVCIALRGGASTTPGQGQILAYIKIDDWMWPAWSISSDEVYLILWTLEIGNSTEEMQAAQAAALAAQQATVKLNQGE